MHTLERNLMCQSAAGFSSSSTKLDKLAGSQPTTDALSVVITFSPVSSST